MEVFIRGNPARKGPMAARGFLQALGSPPPPADPEAAKQSQFGRLELARAIAAADNPLTARVIVNRVWHHHFGRGLVGTPSNFGHLGERPSHPELLDWLAVRLVASGWSLKWLQREIVLSSVYRLSSRQDAENSQRDADNRYLWRMPRRRLDIEAFRDALLAVSGQLDRAQGGPTIELDAGNNRRRTLYARISRHEPNGTLSLFDFPDACVSAEARSSTTVPQQQLFLLNSGFMLAQGRALAARLQAEAASDAERIERAFALAFGRPPEPAERELALAFLALPLAGENRLTRWEQYAQALLATNELMYVD